jgi:hypothetical protein
MSRRRSRREPGRPTLLDRDVEEKLIEATKIGTPMGLAADYVGISKRTFEDWMRRGHNEQNARAAGEEPDPVETKYLELYEKILKARAHATVTSAALIRKSAVGGQVTEVTTRKYRDTEGNVVEEKSEKRTPPDWRAAAWWLERQERSHFGKQVTVDQNVNGQVDVTVNVPELADKITGNLAEALAAAATPAQIGSDADRDTVDIGEVIAEVVE